MNWVITGSDNSLNMNQCWAIINQSLSNKLLSNFNLNVLFFSSKKSFLKMSSARISAILSMFQLTAWVSPAFPLRVLYNSPSDRRVILRLREHSLTEPAMYISHHKKDGLNTQQLMSGTTASCQNFPAWRLIQINALLHTNTFFGPSYWLKTPQVHHQPTWIAAMNAHCVILK